LLSVKLLKKYNSEGRYTVKNIDYIERKIKNLGYCRFAKYCKEMGLSNKLCGHIESHKCRTYIRLEREMRMGGIKQTPIIVRTPKKKKVEGDKQ